jgi:glutamine amidotransferase
MICIIDYDTGNITSVSNMLKKIGAPNIISRKHEDINNADKIILPGVGSFDQGMENLEKYELKDIIIQKVTKDQTPILGICLGAQLLGEKSEEGQKTGLSLIKMDVVKFKSQNNTHHIPHVGWFDIEDLKTGKLFEEISDPRFYFVHSYYFQMKSPKNVTAYNDFHGNKYACAFENQNIMGVQFHPEKSHKYGMMVLNNFAKKY